MNPKIKIGLYLFLVLVLYFPLFGHLGNLPLRVWDESRISVSAVEMLKRSDPLIPHVNGQPDNYNSKPPLVVWTQAISLWAFGTNELAARLPSALAAFLTLLLLFEFLVRTLKDYRIALVSVFSLASSTAWLGYHGVRFAETDSSLVLFSTGYLLCFFAYLNNRRRDLQVLFWLLVLGAVFTKGIVGLIFLGGLFFYLLWKKELLSELKNPLHWILLLVVCCLVAAYYFMREKLSPGYLHAVWINELGGRVDFAEAQLQSPKWYYFKALAVERFVPWGYLIPVGLVYNLRSNNKELRSLGVFSIIMSFWFLLIMSVPDVKNSWYDLPALPFLAILSGMGFVALLDVVLSPLGSKYRSISSFFIIVVFCFFPMYNQRSKFYKPKDAPWDKSFYSISYLLQDALENDSFLEGKKILYKGYNAHHLFYLKGLKHRKVAFEYQHDRFTINTGDQVVFNQDEVKQMLETNYAFEVLDSDYAFLCYRILGVKEV